MWADDTAEAEPMKNPEDTSIGTSICGRQGKIVSKVKYVPIHSLPYTPIDKYSPDDSLPSGRGGGVIDRGYLRALIRREIDST